MDVILYSLGVVKTPEEARLLASQLRAFANAIDQAFPSDAHCMDEAIANWSPPAGGMMVFDEPLERKSARQRVRDFPPEWRPLEPSIKVKLTDISKVICEHVSTHWQDSEKVKLLPSFFEVFLQTTESEIEIQLVAGTSKTYCALVRRKTGYMEVKCFSCIEGNEARIRSNLLKWLKPENLSYTWAEACVQESFELYGLLVPLVMPARNVDAKADS